MSDVQFIDRLLGFFFAAYFVLGRIFRKQRCPGQEDGIHLWVVNNGRYECRYCGQPMTRMRVETDDALLS